MCFVLLLIVVDGFDIFLMVVCRVCFRLLGRLCGFLM